MDFQKSQRLSSSSDVNSSFSMKFRGSAINGYYS